MMGHPDPPKSPHQMSDAELLVGGLDSMKHQDLRHRELRGRIDSLLSSQAELKLALAKIHRADVWILVVGSIAAVATVIFILLALIHVP